MGVKINKKAKYTIVVMDTSILMDHPGIMKNTRRCVFNVPMTAIRQLDGLKDNEDAATRQRARIASQTIENRGIPVVKRYVKINDLDNWGDNKIIGTALQVKADNPDKRVVLLTTDRNMRLVAGYYALEAVGFWEFVKEKGCPAMKYPLWLKICVVLSVGLAVSPLLWAYIDNGELFVLTLMLGWVPMIIFLFICRSMRDGKLMSSVSEYYKGDSVSDDDHHETSKTDFEKNLETGIVDPSDWIFR